MNKLIKQVSKQMQFDIFITQFEIDGLKGKNNITAKNFICGNILEHVNSLNYLGNTLIITNNNYTELEKRHYKT
jgi:hypothetical protein